VGEDAAAGRSYLPRDWLDEAGLARDAILTPTARPGLGMLGQRLAAMAGR